MFLVPFWGDSKPTCLPQDWGGKGLWHGGRRNRALPQGADNGVLDNCDGGRGQMDNTAKCELSMSLSLCTRHQQQGCLSCIAYIFISHV